MGTAREQTSASESDPQRNNPCLLVTAVKREPVPAAMSLACRGSIVTQPSKIAVAVVVVVWGQSELTPWRSRFSPDACPAVGLPSRKSPSSMM